VKAAVSVVSEEVRRPVARPRRLSLPFLWLALPAATTAAVIGWFASVRLSVAAPSTVDDWFGITYSRTALRALLHGSYLSSPSDFLGRYRPAYAAIWNYAQWHLLGNPSVAKAAVWGALRVILFVLAAYLLTAWITRERSISGGSLLWLAPLAIVLTPRVAVDLAAYGPNEPLMTAGLIIGLSLMGTSVRRLVVVRTQGWRRIADAIVLLVGYLVYLFGVYTKEVSFCVLAFFPFLLVWLGPSIRAYIPRSRLGKVSLACLGVLTIAPLVHVATRLAMATLAGDNPYPVPNFGLGTKIYAAGISPFLGAPGALGTWVWFFATPAAVLGAIDLAVRRERDAWLAFGVLLSGFLMSAVALSRGVDPSRYYIPWLVAVAAVGLRGLLRIPIGFRVAVATVAIATLAYGTNGTIADWARAERGGSTAIEMAKSVVSAGCPLYLANFGLERRVAIPELFSFVAAKPVASCQGTNRAYAVSWARAPLPMGFAGDCRPEWRPVVTRNEMTLYSCASFRGTDVPDQIAASGKPGVDAVRLRLTRLAPNPHSLHQPTQNTAGG
jgi:hypothetical protein